MQSFHPNKNMILLPMNIRFFSIFKAAGCSTKLGSLALNFNRGFQDLEEVFNLSTMYCTSGIERIWKFLNGKKSEVSEQNFTEGKALHYLCSIMQCVKLSFMLKNLEN